MKKWYICGETVEFSRRKGSGRPINLCFGQRQEMMSLLLYDAIMISLPVESPSADKISSEEKDITLLSPHKKSKGFNILYRNYCNFEKKS